MTAKIFKEDELIKRCVKAGIKRKDAAKMCDIENKYMKDLGITEE
jgi:hypothetical protein